MSTVPNGNGNGNGHHRQIHIAWATDLRGRQPGKEFFNSLIPPEQHKVENVFRHLEEHGVVSNREKFKALGDDLFEIKSHQVRLLGGFRPGGKFVIAAGVVKKKDDMPPEILSVARRVLKQHDIAAVSTAFVDSHTPRSSPTFKPTIVVPQTRTETIPQLTPTAEEIRLKVIEGQERVWAFVEPRDLLPPDCPIMQSLVRDPRIHNNVIRGELEAYVKAKLTSLSIDSRIALGLLDENLTHLNLGALWAVEFLATREIAKPEADQPVQREIDELLNEELELLTHPEVAPPQDPDRILYWVSVPDKLRGKKRFLFEVIRPARTVSTQRQPMVKARRWSVRSKKWSGLVTKPAAAFKDKASAKDAIVQEALRVR